MNIGDVMGELAAKLASLTELRVHDFPPDSLAAPAVIVGYPQSIDYDVTASRGVDRMTVPMWLIIDRNWDRSTTDKLSDYTAGAGSKSLKALIQTKPHTAFSTARVRSVTFSVISVAGIEYWAGTFLVDITGPGGS